MRGDMENAANTPLAETGLSLGMSKKIVMAQILSTDVVYCTLLSSVNGVERPHGSAYMYLNGDDESCTRTNTVSSTGTHSRKTTRHGYAEIKKSERHRSGERLARTDDVSSYTFECSKCSNHALC